METWKRFRDSHYSASSIGRIRSDAAGIILKQYINWKGYHRVQLYLKRGGRPYYPSVARVVAEAFHGPPPENNFQVNHINGQKSDDRSSNLEWCSPSQNIRHALNTGLKVPITGKRLARKLTGSDVMEIRESDSPGSVMAKRYGVSEGTISSVRSGRWWKHLPLARRSA